MGGKNAHLYTEIRAQHTRERMKKFHLIGMCVCVCMYSPKIHLFIFQTIF